MSTTKPTLVILAAGMGTRYGGLKQIDSLTPENDTIIDFSLFDALRAGFGKFVFIIRKSFENEFKARFNHKLEGKANVVYVYQEIENISEKYINPERTKPYGTGHALSMAKYVVKENFAVINADDFYGAEAFQVMSKSLIVKDKDSYEFNMMSYLLKNTVSDHGYVSRGECTVDENSYLVDITEFTHIEKTARGIVSKDNNGKVMPIDENTIVSMNFWGFTTKYFEFGNQLFESFLIANKDNLKAEFYIPTVIKDILKSGKATVEVLKSDSKWFGMTYKEDKVMVQSEIKKLKDNGVYPKKLWN